jgi:hypothetical protein
MQKLNETEIAALVAYAKKHGRNWKSALRDAWMGMAPYDDSGTLRNLRNVEYFGPAGLERFRLPK